ncbi:hypothetical protein SAMN05428949_0831 [Chitinophaga sp. YR627]|uniref:hypothetical protein n=1 Tax=Chitinophaga sp. YR627 TaxID=1881041 RepID=UPI0008E18158|nr:hypothetical protein [Chitinophaga sp. YR627]SFM79849.1 hypothetical protein SAMN05428949_0831 [Chitinophaga sp. YR627]
MEQIESLIQAGKIAEAIKEAETALGQLPPTDFHQVIGKDLLHLQPIMGKFLSNFYETMEEEESDIKAIYVEMNSFSVQYERWFIHLLSYDTVPNIGNPDWLKEFTGESEKNLTITGYEALQAANKEYMQSEGYRDNERRQACELHEYIVILRFQELVKSTVKAQKGKAAWADVPVFVAAHDFEDLMYVVE